MISVAITTYNQVNFIGRAINSVLCQKCDEPIEILIGDDCSIDGTSEICLRYAVKYPNIIKYVRNSNNVGLIENYRMTLLHCKGDYIAWLDGDDYWCDDTKLRRQIGILNNSSKILTYSNKYIKKGGEVICDDAFNIKGCGDLLCGNPICTPTMLCKSQYLLPYVNEVCDTAQIRNWRTIDYPLWISMLHDYPGSFVWDEAYLAVYRIVHDSGSHPHTKYNAYQWDACICDIKYYYWKRYQLRNFKVVENIFHLRKRMIIQYGMTACEQWKYMLEMVKYMPCVFLQWIKRKIMQ